MDKLFGEYALCILRNRYVGEQECRKNEVFAWGETGILDSLVQMAKTGMVCYVLLAIMESRIISDVIYLARKYIKFKLPPAKANDGDVDNDVMAETDRVAQMTASDFKTHDLVLKDLTKLHGKHPAINHLSIGIGGFVFQWNRKT